MYSNFVTPPDWIDEAKHTVTVVAATPSEIELLWQVAQQGSVDYNFYLYHADMNSPDWLQKAMARSQAVIVNADHWHNSDIYNQSNLFYYGKQLILSPAHKINSLLDYFSFCESQNK